jgi:hypothetical protein
MPALERGREEERVRERERETERDERVLGICNNASESDIVMRARQYKMTYQEHDLAGPPLLSIPRHSAAHSL